MRRITLILSILLLAIIGEPLYAVTPQQKRAKAKEVQMKKREAAKRKAAKQRAAKEKAAKKKRIKEGKPLLYVYAYDLKTGDRLPGAHITAQNINAKPTKKPKINKATDNKRARVSKGLPQGKYWVHATRLGYLPSDTIFFDHRKDEDSVVISLYPEKRLTFTVTDSLTQRPVSANIIVRKPNKERVLQTTSDSIHSLIAVLLDDRVPYYTIEATAIDYFPYFDSIVDPQQFEGVIMSPRVIKSFVLHNIYFATGKTRILPSSEKALNELYSFLKSRPQQRIRIVGHTDNVGSERSNQALSEGRCKEVKKAMINRGIKSARIEIEGRGESDPILPNTSDNNRQMNRRVEIVLIK